MKPYYVLHVSQASRTKNCFEAVAQYSMKWPMYYSLWGLALQEEP